MKCCLCGAKIEGMGHNPDPLGKEGQRCCDRCNALKVIPTRLGFVRGRMEDE